MSPFRRASYDAIGPNRLGKDSHGNPGNTSELSLVIDDLYLPDMGRASHVNRARDSGDPAFADATDMVCVDVKAKDSMVGRRRICRATGPKRLREHHRYAAMEYAHGLAGARIARGPGTP